MIQKTKINKYSIVLYVGFGLLLTYLLIGCTSKNYQDISRSVLSKQLLLPEGKYKSVAWLDQDHVAFIYDPKNLVSDEVNEDARVGVFEISTNTTKDFVTVSTLPGCYSEQGEFSNLSRLPNGYLGFIFNCKSNGYTLYLLNLGLEEITSRQVYPGFIAKAFSFSPDMTQLVQENGNGGGLSERLLLVSSDKIVKELLPDFQRARSPAWSFDGKTIAFAGTKSIPENLSITTSKDIESLFFYPWDIYLMDADGSNPRILLPAVGTVYGLKWSPTNKDLLLFGGNSFNDMAGIWLLDISNMKIKRVWDKNTNFDWSPDGSKIVLLDNEEDATWRSAVFIDLVSILSSKSP